MDYRNDPVEVSCQLIALPTFRGHSDWAKSPQSDNENRRRFSNVTMGAKLGLFDGTSCLETFFAKFDNCATYFHWDTEDQLFQLKASLEGPAGQILWDLGPDATVERIKRLLRCRFGNDNQAERFRAELRTRQRKPGESLQSLYQDICRLMALAYPGPTSELSEIVGRDAFLEALGNQALRVRILEREPRTLDEALNVAVRLEAFDRQGGGETSDKEHWTRSKGHYIKVTAQEAGRGSGTDGCAEAEPDRMMKLEKMLGDLRTEISIVNTKIGSNSSRIQPNEAVLLTNSRSGPEGFPGEGSRSTVADGTHNNNKSHQKGWGRGKRGPPSDDYDKCRRCGGERTLGSGVPIPKLYRN